ncbi:hypothetical protein GH714_022518 [Hevea brasiliensis]|uniref:Uncharacterized protein n=1 Tax=Hevea brasiliensis TaxID=3981 RepID=A0A6A6KKP3_HEVBR|nr:hypothetical protein GH714_022518 [Hevea brasiliensis]
MKGGGPIWEDSLGFLSLHELSYHFRVFRLKLSIYIAMDKEDNYSATFTGLDYSLDHHRHHPQQDHELIKSRIGEASGDNSNGVIDYMLNNPHQQQLSSGFCTSTSLDKLSFADVMQFADFGPKLALNQTKISEEETGIDPIYFLKFPVLNDKREEQSLMVPHLGGENEEI